MHFFPAPYLALVRHGKMKAPGALGSLCDPDRQQGLESSLPPVFLCPFEMSVSTFKIKSAIKDTFFSSLSGVPKIDNTLSASVLSFLSCLAKIQLPLLSGQLLFVFLASPSPAKEDVSGRVMQAAFVPASSRLASQGLLMKFYARKGCHRQEPGNVGLFAGDSSPRQPGLVRFNSRLCFFTGSSFSYCLLVHFRHCKLDSSL